MLVVLCCCRLENCRDGMAVAVHKELVYLSGGSQTHGKEDCWKKYCGYHVNFQAIRAAQRARAAYLMVPLLSSSS